MAEEETELHGLEAPKDDSANYAMIVDTDQHIDVVPVSGETFRDENDEDDEFVDETAEFINPDEVEEVLVDDDNVPMDDADDDDDEVDGEDQQQPQLPLVTDMSRIKLESHTGAVYAVASFYHPISKQLTIVSGGGDDRAYLHQIAPTNSNDDGMNPISSTSKLLQYAHTDSVSSVAINLEFIPESSTDIAKNPRLIAVGGYDGVIVLYDADTGEFLKQLEGPTDVEWLCFHPKGGTVLLAGSAADNTVWMYHMLSSMNYKCLQVFVGHESSVSCGSFSPDGKWALTCSADSTLRLWAPRTGICKHVFRFAPISSQQPSAGLTTMDVNGGIDGNLVIVGAEDGMAHVCHIGTKKIVASLRHYELPSSLDDYNEDGATADLPLSVEAVAFAPSTVNPNWCATGGVDGVVKIWDLSVGSGQCRQTCRPPSLPREQQPMSEQQNSNEISNNSTLVIGGITRLRWHPTLPLIITASTSGSINLWDARNGALLSNLTGSTEVVNDVNVYFTEEDGGKTALVVSGSDDNCVRVHDLDIMAAMQQYAS